MNNWAATVGFSGFNTNLNSFYESSSASLGAGANPFSAFAAVSVEALDANAFSLYFGNASTGVATGWGIGRGSDISDTVAVIEATINVATTGTVTIAAQVPKASIMGRTVLAGITYDGATFSLYINGGLVAAKVAVGAVTAANNGLAIGNVPGAAVTSASPDRIIGGAYIPQALSEAEAAQVFRRFRERGRIGLAGGGLSFGGNTGFQYAYDFAATLPDLIAPDTLANQGYGVGGDLTFQGTIAITRAVDQDPDYASADAFTVTPTATPLNVYLSDANGDDANDGLTPATAVATFARVWELLPTIQTQPFVVHIDGGDATTLVTDYAYVPPPKNLQIGADAFIVLYGDGAGQAGSDGFYEVLAGRTCTGASTSVLVVDTAGGLAVNAYQGYTIEMLDGPAAGHRKHIVENTATNIYPVGAFCTSSGGAATPANGNSYRIVRPNARLDFGGAIAYENTCIHFVNVRFPDYVAGVDPAVLLNKNAVMMFGVESGNQSFSAENGVLYVGTAASASGAYIRPQYIQTMYPLLLAALGDPVTVASAAWDGWGMGDRPGEVYGGVVASLTTFGQSVEVHGYMATGQLYIGGSRNQAFLYGYSLFGGGMFIEDGATCSLDTMSFNFANTRCVISTALVRGSAYVVQGAYDNGPVFIQPTGTDPGIDLRDNSTWSSTGAIDITHAGTGSQISITRGSILQMRGRNLTGQGATSVIGTVDTGGRLSINNATGTTRMLMSGATGLTLRGAASLSISDASGGASTLTSTGGAALIMSEGATCDMRTALTLSGSVNSAANTNGALAVEGAGTSFNQTAGTLTISNTNAGANAHGMYVGRGAAATLLGAGSTVINSGAGGGYGAIAFGNAQLNFVNQPSSVVGVTQDLLVDVNAQPDTALNVSLSSITSTSGARIARAA